jgi:uncharacterized membrane protein YfcA
MAIGGIDLVLVGLAGAAAGALNALAGGGTLITFPALTALGIPAVAANLTSTVAIWPGYLGATLAQSGDLRGQRGRLWVYLPAAVVGGVIGGVLLLLTGERAFRALVPFLILLAAGLLAVQERLRIWIVRRSERAGTAAARAAAGRVGSSAAGAPSASSGRWAVLPVGLAAIYSGYFGAGVSVIVLAVLGLMLDDSLTRLNALKQAIGLSANVAAAAFFVFSGQVVWPAALVMTAASLLGGVWGGRLAGRIDPARLRWLVVVIGVAVAVVYLAR